MQKFDIRTEEEFNEKKKWLFRESIRIEEEKKRIQEEQELLKIQKELMESQQRKNKLLSKQLENQKKLFDKQWQLLEKETRRLAADKQKFERDKLVYKDKTYREIRKNNGISGNAKIFFKGVEDSESLRKRYKELLKIYHPDNMHGDNALIQAINIEYEKMKRTYLGTKAL